MGKCAVLQSCNLFLFILKKMRSKNERAWPQHGKYIQPNLYAIKRVAIIKHYTGLTLLKWHKFDFALNNLFHFLCLCLVANSTIFWNLRTLIHVKLLNKSLILHLSGPSWVERMGRRVKEKRNDSRTLWLIIFHLRTFVLL